MGTNEQILFDRQLVAQVQQGDLGAFEALYRRYANDILAFLASRCPAGTDKHDVAQEVWLRVHRHLRRFDNRHFRGWIYQIAKSCLADQGRKRTRSPEQQWTEPVDAFTIEANEATADEERRMALRECLDAVGGDFAATIRRNKLEGISPPEIAAADGVSVNTVYTRIQRGQKQLKECLQKKLS